MKYYSGEAVFHFSWDQVCTGFWQRYPNPFATHVLTEDTVCRRIIGGNLHSIKILTKTNKAPKWGEFIVPANIKTVFVIEESIVDPIKKTLTTYTRNLGLNKIMSVDEKCVYTPNAENKTWTTCAREAWISSNLYGLTTTLQAFGYERFKKNAGKAINGMNYILSRMYTPPDHVLAAHASVGGMTVKAEKLKTTAKKATDTAKKATELAKSKAAQKVVSVAGGTTAS